ncbi:ZC3H7A [Cervus elaphus hippelaphus]|uniref:ZC3H7A n=1 Tax=Cervus elaphus hippelaphus TaxID=46360 RepID=A0A212CZ44_CEREH|nr:ZC3H7A [Cervus elaphus hippelaphus]
MGKEGVETPWLGGQVFDSGTTVALSVDWLDVVRESLLSDGSLDWEAEEVVKVPAPPAAVLTQEPQRQVPTAHLFILVLPQKEQVTAVVSRNTGTICEFQGVTFFLFFFKYSEALSIADYAKSEEILIPKEIIEKLYINRIACYSNMGFHDKVLEDCDTVLSLNASNYKALYRKSKALSDLGRFREAYDAVAKCSLAVPQYYVNILKISEHMSIHVTDILTPRQEALSVVSIPASSFSHQVGNELASVSIMPLTSVLPLQVEESSLPSTVLANGGKIPFSTPEAFLDDGDMVLGDEIDDLLDSAPETNETVMVNFSLTPS